MADPMGPAGRRGRSRRRPTRRRWFGGSLDRSVLGEVGSSEAEPRRGARDAAVRSWGLHALVVAGAVGAVALDRRIRRRRPGLQLPLAPAAVAVAFNAVIRILEVRHPHDDAWGVQRSELPTDAATTATTLVTSAAAAVSAEALLTRTPSERRLGVSRSSPTAGAVVALLAYDLFHSPLHHLLHVWGPGWRLHSVHHSPTRLNSTNTIRFQFLEIAIDNFIEGLVIGRLGLNRDQHTAYLAVRFTYAQLQHANIDLRSGPLDHVFSTPDLHRWHHSAVYEEGDTNFGSVLSVWDKVFGTWFRPSDRERPDELGIGRMPEFPTRYLELQRVPIDWSKIRERNAATWYAYVEREGSLT